MDVILSLEQLDSICSPKLNYLVLTFLIIYMVQFVDDLFARSKRTKTNNYQRHIYYQKLMVESLKMEDKQLKEELEVAQDIENLQQERDEIKSQLEELDGDDWGSGSSIADFDEKSEHSNSSSSSSSNNKSNINIDKKVSKAPSECSGGQSSDTDDKINPQPEADSNKIAQTRLELEVLQNEAKQLKIVEDEIQLQEEKTLIASQQSRPDLDPALLKYLEDHKEELTLEFLQRAHEILIDIKATQPETSFDDYMKELKRTRSDYATEIAELKMSKKESEIKLQLLRKRYEDELSSFNEIRIEHLFKNSGAKDFLDRQREKNRLKDDIINTLRSELEAKRAEVATWQTKFRDAEKQCNTYWQAWNDTQMKKEQLEAESNAIRERERLLSQGLNLSSASSLVDQVPPPPPVDVPFSYFMKHAKTGFS